MTNKAIETTQAAKESPKKTTKKAVDFDKEQILKSTAFTPIEKDFLVAYLDDKKRYTVKSAKELLDKKMKGAIK